MNEWPTLEQFLKGFTPYNLAIWPMQVVVYIPGIVALFFALKRTRYSSRIVTGVLAFLWLWIAIVPNVIFPPRTLGLFDAVCLALFIIQGAVYVADTLKPRLSFGFRGDAYSFVGLLFIAFAMVGYPVLGYFLGRRYPQVVPFGLVPCPTTVFTVGLLLLTDRKVPKRFLAPPFLGGILGFFPVSIGLWEDIGFVTAGVLGCPLMLYRDRKVQRQESWNRAEPEKMGDRPAGA